MWARPGIMSSFYLQLKDYNAQATSMLLLFYGKHIDVMCLKELRQLSVVLSNLSRKVFDFQFINFSPRRFFLNLERMRSSSKGGRQHGAARNGR